MEEYVMSQPTDAPPLRVEVVNTSDFHEDIAHKIIAAVAVATCVGIVKMGFDYFSAEEREARKAAKETDKTKLESVK